MLGALPAGLIVEGLHVGKVWKQVGCRDHYCHLVGEDLEGIGNVRKLPNEVGFVCMVSLDSIVVPGDFLVELEVFFLQWGGLVFGCPLGWGEDSWHCIWGSGSGLVLVILVHLGSRSVICVRKRSYRVGSVVCAVPSRYSTYCDGIRGASASRL